MTPVGLLDVKKMVKAVLLYVFKISLTASLFSFKYANGVTTGAKKHLNQSVLQGYEMD